MMQQLSLSVIMPALNEENNIEKSVRNALNAIDDYKIDGQVVVVNDGSSDRTQEIATNLQAQDDRVKVVTHEKPWGFGASFWDGVDHATKDHVVLLPGDNENDPWEILMYSPLLEHVDIVIPFVYNKEVRSTYRRILSFVYRMVVNVTFRTNLNYTNGTVLYNRSILMQLPHRSNSFFFQTDILIRLLHRGYLFAEVPYRLEQREGGVSKAVSFPNFVQVAKGYLRLFKDMHYHGDDAQVLDDTKSANRNRVSNDRFQP
ncbi:MAG: glycosyltransferase family 2 protein [bacterium]|nr:glycosyltransferase family 2 protein [bacterium]